MKRSRKGFTLVELLIVVAILGALAAVMTMSSGSSIAKARATAIANNLRICTAGAQVYYLQSGDTTEIASVKTSDVLKATVPNFADFGSGTIKYTSDDTTLGVDGWTVKVTLTGTDSKDIIAALSTIKGFSGVTSNLKYTLFKGKASNQ